MAKNARIAGGISTSDIQVATPLLVFRSQASVDDADQPGVISNELNIPVAGDIGISIAKVYGTISQDATPVATLTTLQTVQELDMDQDNTDVEGALTDVDIENSNSSRIFVQRTSFLNGFTTSGGQTTKMSDHLVIDFTGTDMVSRPLTNRNLRHHVRVAQSAAVDVSVSALILVYYHIVKLSDRALFLLASRRSF